MILPPGVGIAAAGVRPELRNVCSVKVGAHVSGGLKGAVARALEIGAGPIQIFIGSPRTWKEPIPKEEELDSFRKGVADNSLGPVFVHSSYLVNLAAQDPAVLEKSVASLSNQLRLSDKARAAGLIFHPGSAGSSPHDRALKTVVRSMERVLDGYEGSSRLILEVCAGQGETIGDRFDEFREILEAFGWDKRLGVCWDTCHLFASGYDVATAEGLERTVEEFSASVGLEWLLAIHANDSKTGLGSRVDRHENIGRGHLGEEAFERMLCHPALRPLPWILEVPGFDDKGPDRENVEILKRLADRKQSPY